DNAGAPATDQRGFARASHGAADIGAFEAQYYDVTTATDAGPGSLRAALTNAALAGGSVLTIAATGTIPLAGPLPELSRDTQVLGPGADRLTVSGDHHGRVFQVDAGATVLLAGLTIANGDAKADDGGGILNRGTLTVSGCALTGNA